MTFIDLETRLRHMLDAARKAMNATTKKSKDEVFADDILVLALTRLVQIIGEAAKKIPDDFRASHASIPWRDIAGMRDRLVHGYFEVDPDQLWQVVSNDLPILARELEKLVPASGPSKDN